LLNECGPDHNKLFCVTAVVAKQEFTPAWGANKKEAEQRAAANALAEIEGREPPFTPEPAEECDVDEDEPAT
jgi:ribonuclease-3